jgi:AcrR family transcriptional regulator
MDVKAGTYSARAGALTADRVAAAAVSVVARDGFDVLSVRTVATEAGLSGGAVQYHYATRTQLLLAAYAHTVHSIAGRLAGTDLGGPLPVVLGRLCRQALPLDLQRRRECVVWIALTAAAAAHPELAAEHGKALHALIALITEAIAAARAAGQLDPVVDPPAAAAVLAAVLDGLTLHGITGNLTPAALTTTMDAAIAMVLRQEFELPGC